MPHIRSVSVARSVSRTEGVALAIEPTPRKDLVYDLYAAVTQFVYRKKFEPIPGGET